MQEDNVSTPICEDSSFSPSVGDSSVHKLSAKTRRKLLRRSSLKRNSRRKSLEENSSSTSTSPELQDSKIPSALQSSKSQNFWPVENKNSFLSQPRSCLTRNRYPIERSFSEPAITYCDTSNAVLDKDNFNPIEDKLSPKLIETTDTTDTFAGAKPKTQKKIIRHVRSRSDVPVSMLHEELISPTSSLSKITKPYINKTSNYATDLNIIRRKSLLEEGCCSVAPQTECFFPQPHKGQSLTSFLSSEDFHTCAELDKENAHFYISEALISAVEQIKCNQSLKRADEENEDESDEEISHLKQRIRIRRRERQQEKAVQKNINLLSDGRTDTCTTTSQSASSPQSSNYSEPSDYSSSGPDDIDEVELSEANASNLSSIQEKGLSLSMASLYSDADVQRFRNHVEDISDYVMVPRPRVSLEIPVVPVSAEIVALCLLRKFTEKQLPKASDLEWLVSEQDVPQRLLPLPDSWPVSPDDVDEEINPHRTRLRGTVDWAPPRAQIIFNIHPESSRKLLVAKQKYRCAGCGMRIEKDYLHRFRYCKYLGKYFCQCCHSNSSAVIPGHVLQKWDFHRYYVSNFSRDLLERMDTDPLFNIMATNPGLFKKCRQLNLVRLCRLQLFSLKDYILLCKNCYELKQEISNLPSHWVTEPEIYSLQDLIQIKINKMPNQIRQLTADCVKHILNCEFCNSRGFICEMCRDSDSIIYPFQLNNVIQCKDCGACFHKKCHLPNKCPKCIRIQYRKKLQQQSVLSSSEDEQPI